MINKHNRKKNYVILHDEIKALISHDDPIYTNLGNVASAIKYKFDWFWVGFYKVENTELILHAFQGPVACTRIGWKKGVCGECWFKKKPIIVNDVSLFPGHITCNSASKSEIVFPILDNNGNIKFILDIDHSELNTFSEQDIQGMSPILATLASIL
jgi:GAF domain-containing protein